MQFKIYDVPAGGSELWSSTEMQVAVTNGLFNVAIEGIPQTLFDQDVRYLAVFIDGVEASERKRLASVPYAMRCGIPSGVITMWTGTANNVPSGWALCDGSNGTPDLRNRFIVGAGDAYTVNTTGGRTEHNFASDQQGNHQHLIPWGFDGTALYGWADGSGNPIWGSHVQGGCYGKRISEGSSYGDMRIAKTGQEGTHNHKIYATETGSSTVDNRPPYYALCFIMKK